ncbi:MAG: AAA family ATPase [Thermodesulfobacteriota bacterium]|nr:AAA family ATPase [Thermodesulfobacteriota bacterium]
MYTEYFGLKTKPFSITPDPRFLYLSSVHKEALAHLVYALKEQSGFVVLTGEVGTGKTTIINRFLENLSPRMPRVVIKNPNIRSENLYFLLGEAIGIPEDQRKRDYLGEYEERLKQVGGAILIVDEAQGLSLEMLEEIRLLSNMETPNEKLIHIMLIGQQELNEKLRSPNLRQLKQRIGVKFHIPPLGSNETREYIYHRLRVAGYEPREKPLFTLSSIGEIYRYTMGFPRLINIVCDNALLSAYTDDSRQVSSRMIKKVASDLEGSYSKTASRVQPLSGQPDKTRGRPWIWGLITIVIMVALFFGFRGFILPGVEQGVQPKTQTQVETAPVADPEPETTFATETEPGVPPVNKDVTPGPGRKENVMIEADSQAFPEPPVPPTLNRPEKPSGMRVLVHKGDTVAALAADYYGRVNAKILERISQVNPQIGDLDLIHENDEIFLPDINAGTSVIYSVSVASYHSMDEARAVFRDLVGQGLEAAIYPYMDAGQERMYRITIGTFLSRQAAIAFSKQLEERGFVYAAPVKISMEE